MRYTFKTYERLKREQHIHTLFHTGKAFSVFPLRLIYTLQPRVDKKLSPVLAGFSVPKKKFKLSVHRHRVSRLMREVWRLNKHTLYTLVPEDLQMHLFLVYTDTQFPEINKLEVALKQSIDKFATLWAKDANPSSKTPTDV